MTDRFDLYAPVHKGLRHCMNATLVQLGQLDAGDAEQVASTLAALRDLLVWMEAHLAIEQDFIHAAVTMRRGGRLVAVLQHDHDEHGRAFALLRGDADALEHAVAAGEPWHGRRARTHQLYLAMSRFVAENLLHMAVEETEMNPLLWELFGDEELVGIYQAILASEPPEQLQRSVRWLIPALSPDERAAIVTGARGALPPALFDHLVGTMRGLLSSRDFGKLERALAAV